MSLRLVLIALTAACAPMIEAPQEAAPAPAEPVQRAEVQTPPPAASTGEYASFEAWKEGFLSRHGGANRAAYERELAGLTPDPTVISRDRNQPEFSRPVGAYVTGAVTADRLSIGRQRMSEVTQLAAIEQRYGVPREILVGIWAQESAFGRIQGDMDVIRSLATLAHDGRRRDWAESQLKDALDIVISGRASRERLRGSWAGAMGQSQFMPDNYLRLAVDGDGDGRVDIWGSAPDALASAANLLAQAGWKRGQGWAYEVRLPEGFDYALAETDRQPWQVWAARGITLTNGVVLNAAEAGEQASILLPQGANGPAFLALPNHYVIRRYNNSVAYALAIGLLADGMAGRPALTRSWPDEAPLSRDQRFDAQRALQALGFDPGGIDGVIGAGTRRALRAYQQARGITADGHLTAPLVERLRFEAGL
ncbi:MAG: lytic murein transglycosylase [Brevundimonas sp.]|jgi:membrane-bound lytic murein transglycosylase B|uniref:lytic murein transglycosylase n=1 Tax=Brevundimonas sp. TaxID=1871086 RepID=UPI00391DDFDA